MNKLTIFGILTITFIVILLSITIGVDHLTPIGYDPLEPEIMIDEQIEQLRWIFANCECHQRVKDNPETNQLCVQPLASWQNSTHYIDNNLCEFISLEQVGQITSTFGYEIEYDGVIYENEYEISGATVKEIKSDFESMSLISILLNESENGYIKIVIPIELFNKSDISQNPYELEDSITIIDGEEVAFEQLSPNMLKIPFEKGDKLIEIFGMYQI